MTETRIRRPRMTPDRELDVLTAALDLLREVGYEALSFDALAARARCSKATLYRIWPGKPQLVTAAMSTVGPPIVGEIDTGTLRGDLIALTDGLTAHAAADTTLVAAINHAMLTQPEFADNLRPTLLATGDGYIARAIERAVERGELSALPAAAALIPHVIFSFIVSRPLYDGAFADATFLARLIDDIVLPALRNS